jgi:hypothetical protein
VLPLLPVLIRGGRGAARNEEGSDDHNNCFHLFS